MTLTNLPTRTPDTVTATAVAHLSDVAALDSPFDELELRTGTGETFTVDLVSHLLSHLRADPTSRPSTPALLDRDGDFDVDGARRWLSSLPLDELVASHEALHTDRCEYCGTSVLGAHLSMGSPVFWVHADGPRSCGEGRDANPSRAPFRFATVTVQMRLRLPAALGADVSADDVAAYVGRRYVGYFTDVHEPDLGARPSEVLSTEVTITGIDQTP